MLIYSASNDLPNYDKFGHMNEHSIRNQQVGSYFFLLLFSETLSFTLKIEVKWGVQDPVIYHVSLGKLKDNE